MVAFQPLQVQLSVIIADSFEIGSLLFDKARLIMTLKLAMLQYFAL